MNWLRSILKSRYVTYLESEIERLRADNRSLMDAMLIDKGLTPLTPRESRPMPIFKGKMLPSQYRAKMEAQTVPVTVSDGKN